MFNSIFQDEISVSMVFLMAGIALVSGIVYAYLISKKLRTTNGVLITAAVMPMIVSVAICLLGAFLSSSTSTVSRIATLAVALGLIRFRSAHGSAEEMLVLLGSVISGLVFGLGYIAYGVITMAVIAIVYIVLTTFPVFRNKKFESEKTLKITIPESLDYSDVFNEIFNKYLKESEIVGVKTTGMGSMFKITYRIILNDVTKEKEFIDELRTRNGNLEISVVPFIEKDKTL